MFRYRLYKLPDTIMRWVAWKLPRRIVYWSYIRVGAYATTGKHGSTVVPELNMMDALERWETPRGK